MLVELFLLNTDDLTDFCLFVFTSTLTYHVQQISDVIRQAILHEGFSVVEIMFKMISGFQFAQLDRTDFKFRYFGQWIQSIRAG